MKIDKTSNIWNRDNLSFICGEFRIKRKYKEAILKPARLYLD